MTQHFKLFERLVVPIVSNAVLVNIGEIKGVCTTERFAAVFVSKEPATKNYHVAILF